MYFGLSEDQTFFQENIIKYLNDACPLDNLRKIADGDQDLAAAQMLNTEKKRELTKGEENFKNLSAAYCYLYEKAKQHGVLDEEDMEYLFEDETIH